MKKAPKSEGERSDRCELCRFWEDRYYRNYDLERGDTVRGECHRHAPVFTEAMCGAPTVHADENAWQTGRFPLTHRIDWCGEFEQKPPTD